MYPDSQVLQLETRRLSFSKEQFKQLRPHSYKVNVKLDQLNNIVEFAYVERKPLITQT